MRLIDTFNNYRIILWNKAGKSIHYSMFLETLSFPTEDYEYVVFLKFEMPFDFYDIDLVAAKLALESLLSQRPGAFILLTLKHAAPFYQESPEELINSFACSVKLLNEVFQKYGKQTFYAPEFIFEIFNIISSGGTSCKDILVRQIPLDIPADHESPNCDVIIPHHGDHNYLKGVLGFMKKELNVLVGIDGEWDQQLEQIRESNSYAKYFLFAPNPVGPYVIRNRLVDLGENEIIFFQDSDDIPCADRFEQLTTFMLKANCQLCGSHEVEINYEHKFLRANRFPLNVRDALQSGPTHALLHPASAMLRKSFYLCEKLSEERKFANDTKFLYNSFFYLSNISNIDEFLYIRRNRPNSLTTAPETVIGSPARMGLLKKWITDFSLIKLGRLELKNSSLTFQKTQFEVKVEEI